jgi:hypothetical protein
MTLNIPSYVIANKKYILITIQFSDPYIISTCGCIIYFKLTLSNPIFGAHMFIICNI